MEKLNKVIAGLECCGRPNPTNCFDCPYRDDDVCHDTMYQDVLDLLKELSADNQRLRKMWADAVLEKSRVDQERAFYMEIAQTYRGAKPVVHAHWVIERWNSGWIKSCTCSNCGNHPRDAYDPPKYCDNCGAHMDEEVSE